MIKRLMVAAVAVAGISFAVPAVRKMSAWVSARRRRRNRRNRPGDRYREREVIRERDHRDRDETVVIKRGDVIVTTIVIARQSSSTATANRSRCD